MQHPLADFRPLHWRLALEELHNDLMRSQEEGILLSSQLDPREAEHRDISLAEDIWQRGLVYGPPSFYEMMYKSGRPEAFLNL